MKGGFKIGLLLVAACQCFGLWHVGYAQTFALVGDAVSLGDGCYRMTPAISTQNGGVWCEQQLDLAEPFDLAFQLYFGNNDGGADGMVFVLQTMGTNAAGFGGGGIGYQDILSSFGVEFDTWQNDQFADPFYDHIGFISEGSTNHNPPTGLAGPVQANENNPNIEDGADHPVRILWEPLTQTVSVLFDCEVRLSAQVDLPAILGDTQVYWGFVASTGWANNEQRFCLDESELLGTAATLGVCEGQSSILNVPGLPPGTLGCVWSPSTGLDNPFVSNPNCTVESPTTYVVTYPLCQDTGSDTITVEINNLPNASFVLMEENSCTSPVGLNVVNTSPPDPSVTYNWTLNGSGLGTGVNPSNPMAMSPGTWVLEMEAVSTEGCSASDAHEFEVFPSVFADADWFPLEGCSPLPVSFENISINSIQTTLDLKPSGASNWSFSEPLGPEGLDLILEDDGPWTAQLRAISPDGCLDTLWVEEALEVWPLPEVAFSGEPLYGSPDSPDGLNDFWTFENTSTGAVTCHWDFGDGVTSENWQTSHTFETGGVFPVTLTVLSNQGCSASATQFISIVPNLFVYIPAAFTPNMDGYNDAWGPEVSDDSLIRNYHIWIVDRWGELIWESQNPHERWVGQSSIGGSHFAPDGTYSYVLQIQTTIGGDQTREWRGTVAVLR